jgi:hypothetical protein
MTAYLLESRREPQKLVGIASLFLTLNLAGFLAISYVPGILSVDHRAITIPFRCAMLALSLYAVYKILAVSHLRLVVSATTLLVVAFWSFYIIRFLSDAILFPVSIGSDPADIALFLFGMSLPAFTVSYLFSEINLYKKALVWSMLALGACCAISMLRASAPHGKSQELTSGNDILNHIGYGHMGLTAMILGLFVLLQIGSLRRGRLLRVLAAATVCLGAFTILAASSRGAVVAAVVLLPILVYLGLRCGSRMLTIGICIALLFVVSGSVAYLAGRGIDPTHVLWSVESYSTSSGGVYERASLARDAWQEYLEHPILGSSIVERRSLFYPHNCIIEAFMATGTFGGSIFVLILLLAVYRAIRIAKTNVAMSWISLCFLQVLIGAMFSGGLYDNPLMWGMLGVMLGVKMPKTRDRHAKSQGTYAR